MERISRIGTTMCALAGYLFIAGCGADAQENAAQVRVPQPIPATPLGITLVNITKVNGLAPPSYLWTRLGDASGKTLFISAADQPGKSNCEADCAKDFPPVIANAGSVAFGDWTLVKRSDGEQQWAYKSSPLYTFSKEARLNQVVDTLLSKEDSKQGGGNRRRRTLEDALEPPAGWSVARFEPEKGLVLPASIHVLTVAVQDGMGDALVSSEGMTLYGFDGTTREAAKASCAKEYGVPRQHVQREVSAVSGA